MEVRESHRCPIKAEAQALAQKVGSYRFHICSLVWYDNLNQVNYASKLLQSVTMQLDVAIDLPTMAETSLRRCRGNGSAAAQASSRDKGDEMNVEAVLKEKRLRSTKKQFSYEAPDEPIRDAMKRLETEFFNVVMDTTIESLKERFQALGETRTKYGALLNLKNFDVEILFNQCDEFCSTLNTEKEKRHLWKGTGS